ARKSALRRGSCNFAASMTRVLITGGAGFIGSHLAAELLAHGYTVRALDSLVPPMHGAGPAQRPPYLARGGEMLVGGARARVAVARALDRVDVVFHLAARVGIGQSMYEIAEYTSVNTLGTAILLEALVEYPVKRLIVASSMSVYGEGLYRDEDNHVVSTAQRT